MKEYDINICLAALGKVFCYNPAVGVELLEKVKDPRVPFTLSRDGLRDLFGPFSSSAAKIGTELYDKTAVELERIRASGGYFLGATDPSFPALLKECTDYPLGLYVRSLSPPGEVFGLHRAVAFVGTRDISPYGKQWSASLVESLSRCTEKVTVVSGLALGVDGIAHRTALDSGLPTIGVMATGIDDVYPRQHLSLARDIVSAPGCALISSYPAGTSPLATQFLSRNRIIAGLSEATVLVESRVKGGGMITARHASGYGRDVYALPGRVDDVRSGGCNLLIRDCIAGAVTGGEDLIRKLGLSCRIPRKKVRFAEYLHARLSTGTAPDDIPAAIKLAEAVRAERGITAAELSRTLGMPYGEVSRLLTALECEGIISTDILQRCTINLKNV